MFGLFKILMRQRFAKQNNHQKNEWNIIQVLLVLLGKMSRNSSRLEIELWVCWNYKLLTLFELWKCKKIDAFMLIYGWFNDFWIWNWIIHKNVIDFISFPGFWGDLCKLIEFFQGDGGLLVAGLIKGGFHEFCGICYPSPPLIRRIFISSSFS